MSEFLGRIVLSSCPPLRFGYVQESGGQSFIGVTFPGRNTVAHSREGSQTPVCHLKNV